MYKRSRKVEVYCASCLSIHSHVQHTHTLIYIFIRATHQIPAPTNTRNTGGTGCLVAQELLNLELTRPDLKAALCDLYITGAKEVDIAGGRKAIVVCIPFKLRTAFHKVHARSVRELEKKISGKHVLLLAQRNHLGKSFAVPGLEP